MMENRPPPKLTERKSADLTSFDKELTTATELEAFDSSSVRVRGATETRAIQAAIAETLAKTLQKFPRRVKLSTPHQTAGGTNRAEGNH